MRSPLRNPLTVSNAAVLLALALSACSEPIAPDMSAPSAANLAKGGNGGGGGKPGGGDGDGGTGQNPKGGTVVHGDLTLAESDAPAIASTCPTPGDFRSGNGWALVFGKSGCLIVSPLRATTVDGDYALADDIVIGVQLEKGKNGRITHVRLGGQDVDGPEGIFHDTDWLPVFEPVVPTKAGFTLHVHASNVPVWRWSSHLPRDGERVEIVGVISIGDIVYPAQ